MVYHGISHLQTHSYIRKPINVPYFEGLDPWGVDPRIFPSGCLMVCPDGMDKCDASEMARARELEMLGIQPEGFQWGSQPANKVDLTSQECQDL